MGEQDVINGLIDRINRDAREDRLIAEVNRKGSTRHTIAALYREAIICGANSVSWPNVNAAILNRYSVYGLDYIKKCAWGVGAVGRRAVAAKPAKAKRAVPPAASEAQEKGIV